MLKRRGADIVCYDANPPSPSDQNTWYVLAPYTEVTAADGADAAARHADRTLFLAWPYVDETAATGAPTDHPLSSLTRGCPLASLGKGRGWPLSASLFSRKQRMATHRLSRRTECLPGKAGYNTRE